MVSAWLLGGDSRTPTRRHRRRFKGRWGDRSHCRGAVPLASLSSGL